MRKFFRHLLLLLSAVSVFFIFCYYSYPISEQDMDLYVEQNYGTIIEKKETRGSIIYLYKGEAGESKIIVYNKSILFRHKFRKYSIKGGSYDNLSDNYEVFDIMKHSTGIKISIVKDIYDIKLTKEIIKSMIGVILVWTILERKSGGCRKTKST